MTRSEELLVSREGHVGRIRLNRPKALNSLTLAMVRRFTEALWEFAADQSILAVLVTGEGERGLCAGGDIRALYDLRDGDKEPYRIFWREEYRLNAMIASFPKPYVVLMDGLVMGGGVGVSAHGDYRIVTERTRVAMPETTIGFIPDVGGTWLLTRRNGVGIYLALSGAAVTGADAIHAGLADVEIQSSRAEELLARLRGIDRAQDIRVIVSSFVTIPPPGEMERHKDLLDHAMQGQGVADILDRLRASGELFAKTAAERIAANSPTSLVVTRRLLALASKARRLKDCLTNEFHAASRLLESHDLYEGIRAAIIDKDKRPHWRPSRLEDVSDRTVADILAGDGGPDPIFEAPRPFPVANRAPSSKESAAGGRRMQDTFQDSVFVLGAARTPIGALLGELKDMAAPELGACAIRAAVERGGVGFENVDECVMGCVLSAGVGQAPARQAALAAGLSDATPCVTVNKMCGSGMKAVMDAHDRLRAGGGTVVVAGGMESMSNAPYLLPRARAGFRMGHRQALDHMFYDGLEDAYEKGRLMGSFAEDCAEAFQFTRAMQDDFALSSLARAQQAADQGLFAAEIAPVLPGPGSALVVSRDELPRKADPTAIPKLRPAFREGGSLTAANSSAISDGAAALTLATAAYTEARSLQPMARIVGHATHAGPPASFPTAPIDVIRKLVEKIGWRLEEVDLFEINEAFAVVTMAAMRELGLSRNKVNVHGGACALGHPIGASGARIIVTLLAALKHYDLRTGVAAMCIGGGEATAIAVERL